MYYKLVSVNVNHKSFVFVIDFLYYYYFYFLQCSVIYLYVELKCLFSFKIVFFIKFSIALNKFILPLKMKIAVLLCQHKYVYL